jgi:branched-chain amino acid transport system permease protein
MNLAVYSRNLRKNYSQDTALFYTLASKVWLYIFCGLVLIYPNIVSKYYIYIVNITFINIIATIGLNILTGLTGQISLGQAAFLAIGAYTSTYLTARFSCPILLTLPASGFMAALGGLLIGIPSLRLKGLYLAITTLGFHYIVEHIVTHWHSVTGGPKGITIPYPSIFGYALSTDKNFYYFTLFILVLLMIYAKNLSRSRDGLAFRAIRDNDIAAKVMGISLTGFKLTSFAISSFFVGIAGCLYANYLTSIGPEAFTLHQAIQYLAMVIVGGFGSVILGSLLGAIFMTLIPEFLLLSIEPLVKLYPNVAGMFSDIRTSFFGLIIILFLIFEPDGLSGRWSKIKNYWTMYPYSY